MKKHSGSNKRIYSLFLALILILASFIYFFKLGSESLTTDEYFSFHVAKQPLKEIIFKHQEPNNPNTLPPLYEIMLHFWIKAFGSSELAQRSLSAVLGIISVFIIYKLASLLFDIQTGTITCLLSSLSFLWFSCFRLNRCYSLFIALTLLSFYIYFYYSNNKSSKFSLLGLIIANIALIYTHYFGFLVILLELIFSAFEFRRNKGWFINILIMCAWMYFAYIPWYSNLFYDLSKEPLMQQKIYYPNIWYQVLSIVVAVLSDFHFKWSPMLTIFYLPLLIYGFIKFTKQKTKSSNILFVCLISIPIIPSVLIYCFTHADRIRYYAPFSFPLLMFLAYGIKQVLAKNYKKIILIPVVLSIATFNFMDFSDFFRYPLYENWKLAAKYIKEIPDYQNKNMVFVFQTRYNPAVFAYYYWNDTIASRLVDNIDTYEVYEEDLAPAKTRHKIYLISIMKDRDFLRKLDSLPEDAWIWVLRYHDIFFPSEFRILNNGRYFFHQIVLNKELPQIDFFLLKRIKQ